MTREGLSDILASLSDLLELKGFASVVDGCTQVLAQFSDAHEFLHLRSRAQSELGQGAVALEDSIAACKLAPTVLAYMFHYFQVRIQVGQPEFIVTHINHRFALLSAEDKKSMVGYVREALKCGIFSKLEVDPSVLAELVRDTEG